MEDTCAQAAKPLASMRFLARNLNKNKRKLRLAALARDF
jgi:hypothetical protein